MDEHTANLEASTSTVTIAIVREGPTELAVRFSHEGRHLEIVLQGVEPDDDTSDVALVELALNFFLPYGSIEAFIAAAEAHGHGVLEHPSPPEADRSAGSGGAEEDGGV